MFSVFLSYYFICMCALIIKLKSKRNVRKVIPEPEDLRSALISVPLAISQTPVFTAGPRIRS